MNRCVMHMLMNKRNAIIEFRLFLDQTICGVYRFLLYMSNTYELILNKWRKVAQNKHI